MKDAAKKSARVGQELSEQINPKRYEELANEIKAFFESPKFLSIMDEIDDKKLQLTPDRYNRLLIQLPFLTVLQNGHCAKLANILKRQDLYTQAPHSELPGMWTFQLNK